jgi:hypothetical protein
MSTKRVYIVHHSHEPVESDCYSSLLKLANELNLNLSYKGLASKISRAEKRTNKKMIRIKDVEGNRITVEIQEIK